MEGEGGVGDGTGSAVVNREMSYLSDYGVWSRYAAFGGYSTNQWPGGRVAAQPRIETIHRRKRAVADLEDLVGRYEAVNIKLDKTGGLTEALVMAREARARGFRIMVGSMVATSLAAAPALLLAEDADWVDLDGPLLLARDRDPGLLIEDGLIHPPPTELWG